MAWMPLAAILAAGCATERADKPALTEVSVPDAQPIAVSSPQVDTNTVPAAMAVPVITNQLPIVTVPPPANTPVAPRIFLPTNGWVLLESWCQANGLDVCRRVAPEKYEVSASRGKLSFQIGSQSVAWHGASVWLGFAPRYIRGKPHVHWLDVEKNLEPLLRPLSMPCRPDRVVVIDPGHGGMDGGTVSVRQQLEKNLALDWALRLEALLRTNGWKVHLTRTNDQDLSLADRIAVADRVGANLFVSLHFNGLSADARHSGVETFCTTPVGMPSSVKRNHDDPIVQAYPNNAFDAENIRLALRLHQQVLAATRATDGGVRRARFMTVLRGQRRPAVLIEGGFLSNADEARRLSTPEYRQKLAQAVAQALD